MRTVIRDEVLLSDNTAIADDQGNKRSYRELSEGAEDLRLCVEKRSLLFLLCDHQTETAEFIYEILYIHAVPLLLPGEIDEELLEQLMQIYQPGYLYCQNSRKTAGTERRVKEWKNHTLWKTGAPEVSIHPDVALLLSTSGTTGSSKLVKLTYDNLYDNAAYGCRHLQIEVGQKGLSPLPLHYAFGLSFCLWHWHCGATVLLTEESVFGRGFQEFYMKEKAVNFAATPYTYRMLQKIRFWDQEKAAFLNFAISSGAQITEQEHLELVSVLKEKFWVGYGQTECIGIVLAASFDERHVRTGTVGRAFDNAEVTMDPKTGEMLIRSRSVCMGYAVSREDLETGDVNHGILHTGDVVKIEDGYIYLQGRLKRFVKILGKRVSLDDIGNYLENKYQNAEFACTGTDDHIEIYHTDPGSCAEEEIRELLYRNMKIPAEFITCFCLEKMPRNSSGKIAYAGLGGPAYKKDGGVS
ncbi:MAG: AMP-binding protein [Lachnospiraceae bacterium]|nr:AMP-binding protein [Lachnospiraceae bacterium]